jgi:hypothetical protein
VTEPDTASAAAQREKAAYLRGYESEATMLSTATIAQAAL